MESKLKRLNRIKDETNRVYEKIREEQLREIQKHELKAAKQKVVNAKPFLPYDDINIVHQRKRSRALTFGENQELVQYQKRIGIPINEEALKPSPPPHSNMSNEPLGKPIGKPTNTPIIPLPNQGQHGYQNQGQHGYPNLSAAFIKPAGCSNGMPPPLPASNICRPAPPAPPKPAPKPPVQKRKGKLAKWFGLGK
jgi:hypothetical protein